MHKQNEMLMKKMSAIIEQIVVFKGTIELEQEAMYKLNNVSLTGYKSK